MSDEAQEFKKRFFHGMSYAAATVNVITSDGPAGRVGITVSAMSSVSADTPRPTLLICVNENSASAAPILENGVFCVNILHDHQSYISDVFAGRHNDKIEDKFDCTQWVLGKTGSPRVADALVAFDCKIVSTKKVGTHHVIFAEVQDIYTAEKGSALLYANRSYSSSQPITVSNVNFGAPAEAHISIGCFHTFGPYIVPRMIKEISKHYEGASVQLIEGDNRRIKESVLAGEVDIALLYDFDLGPDIEFKTLAELKPYILVSEDHPFAKLGEIALEDLQNAPMIAVAGTSSRDQLGDVLRARGIQPNVIFKASSFEMMRGMVGQGLGFALVIARPESHVSYDGKTLVAIQISDAFPSQRVVVVRRKGGVLNSIANDIFENGLGTLALF